MNHERLTRMVLRTPAQVRALCSPARFEILQFLVNVGPCTVAQLAREMDTAADGLYRHLRALLKAGLAVEVQTRQRGRHREVVLDAAAEFYTVDYDVKTARNAAAYAKVVQLVLRKTERCLLSILGAGEVAKDGSNLALWFKTSWLTDAEVRQVQSTLRNLRDLLEKGQRRPSHARSNAKLYAVTAVMVPVVRSRRNPVSTTTDRPQASTRRAARKAPAQ